MLCIPKRNIESNLQLDIFYRCLFRRIENHLCTSNKRFIKKKSNQRVYTLEILSVQIFRKNESVLGKRMKN